MTEGKYTSPRWNATTKLVVTLILVVVIGALLVEFQSLIPPLMMSFIIVYLLYPVADFIRKRTGLAWGWAVSLVYLVILLILLSLAGFGGVELFFQVQSVISQAETGLDSLNSFIAQISSQVIVLGPFTYDLKALDLTTLSQNLLSALQPMLSQTGSLVGTVASGAASTVGWMFFELFISYFILVESGGLRQGILRIEIPNYGEDMRRLGDALGRTWNAFLRGQFIIVGITIATYTVVLSLLGVRYGIGLALLGGLSKFLPYVGPAILWVLLGFIAFFQDFKLGGLDPLIYAGLVVVVLMAVDQIIDSFIAPRILASALKVHPAAVVVSTLVAASLLGLLGVVIAAPMLATIQLIGRYITRKLFDLDPWAEDGTPAPVPDAAPQPPPAPKPSPKKQRPGK
jgi:predicted PurR-regulated permease PerM